MTSEVSLDLLGGVFELSDAVSSGLFATAAFAADLPYSISISDILFPLRNCFAAFNGAYSSLTSDDDYSVK